MCPWICEHPAPPLAAIAAAVLVGGCGAAAAIQTRHEATVAGPRRALSQPRVVRGVLITSGGARRTIKPGTRIAATRLATRAFADARHGFALFTSAGGETYPAATADGGRVWRIVGPVLHAPAAQGPLAVSRVAIGRPGTYIAFGPGSVVDVTTDGGKQWWRAGLGDEVPAAVAIGRQLVAFAQQQVPTQRQPLRAVVWVYRSTDGGRVWRADHLLAPP